MHLTGHLAIKCIMAISLDSTFKQCICLLQNGSVLAVRLEDGTRRLSLVHSSEDAQLNSYPRCVRSAAHTVSKTFHTVDRAVASLLTLLAGADTSLNFTRLAVTLPDKEVVLKRKIFINKYFYFIFLVTNIVTLH